MFINEASMEVSADWEFLFRKKHPRTSYGRNAKNDFLIAHGIFPIKRFPREVGKEYIEREPQKIAGEWLEVLEAK